MNPKKEPTASQRAVASDAYGMFNALLMEGFTAEQALVVLGQMLSAMIMKSND